MNGSDQHLVTTSAQLREIAGHPNPVPAAKVINHIDPICARIIAASPFLVMATKGADGLLDLSPKGDPAGFVGVLDEKTLAIPDRPGNRRFDSYENILTDPAVALIFLIPGHGDALRVSGEARISRDPELLARFAVQGREPQFVLLVHVREAFTHCPKCMIRSAMWRPDAWPDLSDAPSLTEAMVAHGQLTRSIEDMQAGIDRDREERLYCGRLYGIVASEPAFRTFS